MLEVVQPSVDEFKFDNERLMAPFAKDVFREALFHMHPDKLPALDGLNLPFYRRFWHLCGDELTLACSSRIKDGVFPPNVNDTTIVLIPKCVVPLCMKDLQPISLCNVIYKFLSKVLAW